MKQALDKQVNETGLHLDEEVHNELLVIMQQNSAELAKAFPSDSFRHLFWKQQFEAASKSNPKQMKWHPLMIRWCLSIKLKSSSAYESLYNLGIIQLPPQRTLRDYTHVIKPYSGFSNDVAR